MTTSEYNSIGKVVRVEHNQETGEVRLIMEITDPRFKRRVLASKDLQDIISVNGKDVMVVASKSKKSET